MTNRLRPDQFVLAAIVTVFMIGSSPAAYGGGNPSTIRTPAGQMCPSGSYVIGFDSEGNIICNEACGNGVLNTGAEGVDTDGDEKELAAETSATDPDGDEEELAAKTSATDPGSIPSISTPVISDVEPRSVVWGTSELAITVIGTGFHAESVIIFEGSTYKPVVDQAGTRLDTTIATANLGIGSYAIKVSNGSGLDNTFKRALVVY
jgi:hypothetical protein